MGLRLHSATGKLQMRPRKEISENWKEERLGDSEIKIFMNNSGVSLLKATS